MKTNKRTVLMVMTGIVLTTGSAWAGDLNPPGAPGSTMKTLTEVYDRAQTAQNSAETAETAAYAAQIAAEAAEPRTPISGAVTITQPGSYYLTGNSTGRITIQADNVTLDLMGFRLAVGTGDAISIPSGYGVNTLIRNGTLRSGSGSVALDGRYADDCIFEDLRIEGNNAFCGIYADNRCVVRDCAVRDCNNRGISVGDSTEVRDCRVNGGTLDGIQAGSNCRIVGNVVEDHGGDGLYITGSGNYLDGNIVKGNADNYDIAANNQLNLLLCEIPETLDWPCSVKLAGTLSTSQTTVNGITVNANDVTIDMGGHTLVGPGESSGNGIFQGSGYRTLRVFNGKVTGWGGTGMGGINTFNSKSTILSDLQATANQDGILSGINSTVSDCTALQNDFNGIRANSGSTLSGCTANENAIEGIYANSGCTLSDCSANGNTHNGIRANGSTLSGCVATDNGASGILGAYGGKITDCMALSNTGNGIEIVQDCFVADCTCRGNGADGAGAGIYSYGYGNRIDGNNVTDNELGIDMDYSGNIIVRNTATGNGTDYDIAAGNDTGTIRTTPVSAGAWDNFSF